MRLESEPGKGSTFHVYLPLPGLDDQPADLALSNRPVLLLISSREQPLAEIAEFSRRQGLTIRRLRPDDDVEQVLAGGCPAALAWEQADATSGDWFLLQQLRRHARLCRLPFLLYAQGQSDGPGLGLTDMVVKPVSRPTLLGIINALCPVQAAGPILIVDDDPQALDLYQAVVRQGLPGYPVITATDGAAALKSMADRAPSLVLLDLVMPGMDGFQVLDWMRSNSSTRPVPVLVLSGRALSLDDFARLEKHTRIRFQSKGILSEEEMAAYLRQVLQDGDNLPQHTSALVKRAVAYLHQNYSSPLLRREVAEATGVSQDYLTRVFHQELGLSPWAYLNRFRVKQARELLSTTAYSITAIALRVGFTDPAYFSRVFRQVAGMSPRALRDLSS